MPSVLIIEDEHALAAALSTIVRRLGGEPSVAASGQSGLGKLEKRAFDLIVLDIGLPDMNGLEVLKSVRASDNQTPVIIITAHGTLDNALEAKQHGASEYFLKPLDLTEFQGALRSFFEKPAAAVSPADDLRPARGSLMIGGAPGMQRAFAAIAQACGADAPVLITGPAGAGKSLAARVIHGNSTRRDGPFIAFRADEWQPQQLDAELFGDGGLFARAMSGVLFVEEIGDLPLPIQAGLEKRLKSPAAGHPRIVAASATDLLARVRDGRFREDLFYRLKIIEVALPPLKERTEDIPSLAAFFIGQAAGGEREVSISEQALACLKAHPWPGNVRELRNAMQHAAAVGAGSVVLPRHLPESISRVAEPSKTSRSHLDDALQETMARWLDQKLTASENELPAYDDIAGQIESLMLKLLLPRFDHKPTRLAAALRMNRATLRRKCRELL